MSEMRERDGFYNADAFWLSGWNSNIIFLITSLQFYNPHTCRSDSLQWAFYFSCIDNSVFLYLDITQ